MFERGRFKDKAKPRSVLSKSAQVRVFLPQVLFRTQGVHLERASKCTVRGLQGCTFTRNKVRPGVVQSQAGTFKSRCKAPFPAGDRRSDAGSGRSPSDRGAKFSGLVQ